MVEMDRVEEVEKAEMEERLKEGREEENKE